MGLCLDSKYSRIVENWRGEQVWGGGWSNRKSERFRDGARRCSHTIRQPAYSQKVGVRAVSAIPERVMNRYSELVDALRKKLRAKGKVLADQKWVFEQLLKSPTWRWTAPIRWAANRFRRSKNGSLRELHPPTQQAPEQVAEFSESETTAHVKTFLTSLCRTSLSSFMASESRLEMPTCTEPVVSVILVLYNRAELTLACLRSIAECGERNIETVIVDNCSSDETPHLLKRVSGARIITNSSNLHFLAGVNQAAGECRGDYLLLLNNDAQLLPGALQSALQTLRSSSDIGAVGGKILLVDWSLQEAGSIVWRDGSCVGYGRGDDPFAPMYCFRRDVDYCSGAFLLTPRKVWEELGGFDRVYAPAYYEETDYCMRLWARGLRVVYEPSAAILHYEFASSQSRGSAIELQARNQRIFVERHRAILEGHEEPAAESIVSARARNGRSRVLIIDDRVPHLWLGSGFPRANALHRALNRLGYFVTSYPVDVISEPWEQAYSDLPREIEIMLGVGPQFVESFLRNRRGYYSTIVASRPHNMQLVAGLRAAHPDWFEGVQLVYDAGALFTEREIGLRELSGHPMSPDEIRAAVEAEIRIAAGADKVITVSENERAAFLSHGIRSVEVLGHSIELAPGDAPFDSREGFLFVGAVHTDASPNADSLIWFLENILPRIRDKLGDVSFTIAGLNRSDRIRAMVHPGTRIVGHLPSLDNLYEEARIFVAPTRCAAGIPHKIHEAAAKGLPVVATPLLAKQLGWTDRELGIGDTADSFAKRCVEIYADGQ